MKLTQSEKTNFALAIGFMITAVIHTIILVALGVKGGILSNIHLALATGYLLATMVGIGKFHQGFTEGGQKSKGVPKTQADFEPGKLIEVHTVRGTTGNQSVVVVVGYVEHFEACIFPRQCCDFGDKGMKYEDAQYFKVDPDYQGVVHFYSDENGSQLPRSPKKETARISLPTEPPKTTSQEPAGLGFLAKVAEWENQDDEGEKGPQ